MKKILSIISCLCLITMVFLPTAVFGKSEGLSEKTVAPESDIVGSDNRETIRLSPQEKTYIKNHPVIKVSNELDYPPFDFAIEGQPQGYTIDLLNLLAEKIGIKIEYVNGYTWDEIVQLFREHKLDLLHSLVKTPERSKFMLFSDRFFRDRQMYITRKENPDITDVTQLYDKTISQGKNWSTTELFQANYPQIPLLIVDNLEEMLSAVAYGKVDATIADEVAATYMIKQKGMSDLKLSGWAKEFDQLVGLNFHFAGQMDAPELISMLNKALASLTVEELDGLRRKWFGEDFGNASSGEAAQTTTTTLPLSLAEKNYLKTKKEITMCIDPDWAPFEMIDENGNYVGLTADYFAIFQKMIPVPIRLVKTETWDESVRFAKARKCDILSMLSESPERSKYLNFTEPYINANVVLVARKDVVYLDGLQSLSGKTLAIVKSHVYEEIVNTSYPEVQIIPVSNLAEGVQKVSNGSAYAAIGSLLSILPQIQSQGLSNLKVAGPANLENKFCIGARNDEPELVSIFDKAIKSIDRDTENQLLRRWYTVSIEESFDYSLLWKISAAALLVMAVILYWNRRLSAMARKLNMAKDDAEAANRAKSAFLANMSHELRTPLNAILGFSELMRDDQDLSPKHKEELAIINRSGGYLLELINDVLELAKVEAGQEDYTESSFDLYDTLENIVKMIRPRVEKKDLQLVVERGDNVPRYIKTDERKLRQILLNLLGNAVKFTEAGGVALRVKRHDEEEAAEKDSICLCFEVEDSGPGIEPDERETMFEAFTQTRSGYEKKEGTGLGLAICRQFVHHLGGEIMVSGSAGQGTIVMATVRVRTAAASDIRSQKPARRVIGLKSDGSGQDQAYRIIVVDDQKENRTLLQRILEKVGFLVKTAENGQQAVALTEAWKPHLIWMDIRMPVMDGYEATKAIRRTIENKDGARPIIIALSASAFKEDHDAVLAAGCDDFLRRPFSEEEILTRIHEHLGVDYIYETVEVPTASGAESETWNAEAFKSEIGRLPHEIRRQLKTAIELSDIEQIDQLVADIRVEHEVLAVELKNRLDTFQYDRILTLLN